MHFYVGTRRSPDAIRRWRHCYQEIDKVRPHEPADYGATAFFFLFSSSSFTNCW